MRTSMANSDLVGRSAAAFQKAKKQAERLAAAAGITPGPLSSLQGSGSSSGDDDEYGSYRYRSMLGSMEKSDDEAMGASYAPNKYVVNVVAGFAIKEKK